MNCFGIDFQYFNIKANIILEEIRILQCNMHDQVHNQINEYKINKRYSYIEEIQIRFKFLNYIFNYSPLKLIKHDINILWNVSIIDTNTQQESDEFFKFFNQRLINQQIKNMDDNIPAYLFNLILKNIDPTNISINGYEMFEKYCIFLNVQKNYIKILEKVVRTVRTYWLIVYLQI